MIEGYRVRLTCNDYAGFLIKQTAVYGEKGARPMTIVPVLHGHVPPCVRARGERSVNKSWASMFFMGAKGGLLFLYAEEGANGGMPFVVLNWKTDHESAAILQNIRGLL